MSNKQIISKDTPFFIIQLNTDTFQTLDYYKTEVERLNKVIKDQHKMVNQIIEKKEYIRMLEGFRNYMLLECIILRGKITPFQCKDTIDKEKCKFNIDCKPRKDFLNRII